MWKFIKILVILYVGCVLVGIGLVSFLTVVGTPIGVLCFSLAGKLASRPLDKYVDSSVYT